MQVVKNVCFLMLFLSTFVFADDQKKINDIKNEIKDIDAQILNAKAKLNLLKETIENKKKLLSDAENKANAGLSKEGKSLLRKKNKLKGQVNKIVKQIRNYQKEIKKYENGKAQQLVKKRPVKKRPVKKQPVKKQPVKKQPVKKQPVKKQPVKKQPVKIAAPTGGGGGVSLTANDRQRIKQINAIKNKPIPLAKIVTAQKCGECHQKETGVWKKTPHFETFNKMTKKPRAKQIFKKVGGKGSIKRGGRCSKCHFTQNLKRGKPKAVAGVSCESCHGAGKDWIQIHNNKSVPKAPRRKDAMSKGMNNPSDIYLIAQNCYGCHSVPDEELVNKGGHKPGSKFELVKWSQGMIRHNFISGKNTSNPKSPIKRLRVMFVTGLMLDLEYSLRGLAKAKTQGIYYKSMKSRVRKASQTLTLANQKSGGIKEINELLTLFKKLNLNKKAHLLAGADLITLKAKDFTKNHDGSKLGSLDQYLPKSFK